MKKSEIDQYHTAYFDAHAILLRAYDRASAQGGKKILWRSLWYVANEAAKLPEPNSETVLYGLPKGATERYEEVLLLTNGTPELIERAKALASQDGFHSFRVAQIDLSQAPDFGDPIIYKKDFIVSDRELGKKKAGRK